jgi:hypothetical protein
MSHPSPRAPKAARAFLRGTAIAILALSLAAGTALAGKPSGGGSTTSGSVALVMVVDAAGDGAPNWADSVTYTVTSSVAQPYVSTTCTQAGTLVLSTSAGFYPGYSWPSAQTVSLRSDRWTAGAADCTAKLYYNGRRGPVTITTTAFHVNP